MKIKNKNNTKKAVKGISSQTLVTIILGLVEVVTFSIMSRLLSKEDFGYYAAISAIVVVFASFAETGIGAAIIQRKQIDTNYINNAFTLSLIFGATVMSILIFSSSLISNIIADNNIRFPLILMSITLLLNCLISVNVSIMYRKLQFLKVGFIHLFSLVLTSIVAIILAIKGFGFYAILVKAILTSVSTYILSLVFCRTRFSFSLNKNTVKSIFRFSGWLMASVVFRNFAQQVDRLMMPNLLSVTTLGAYNRPKDFVNQISGKINSIFDIVLFPVLSSIQDDKTRLSSAFRRSFHFLNILSTLLSLAFILNSELIIRVFFGEEWIYLRSVLCVFAVSVIFNVDGRLADCYLRSLALTRKQFYFRIIETFAKIVCVLIGYHWDMIGIAIAIVFADATMKMIKVTYVAIYIDTGSRYIFVDFVKSLKFLLVFLPINILAVWLCPHSWQGNLLILGVFVLSIIIVFGMLPMLVGRRYHDEVWLKIMNILRSKITSVH